MTSQINPNDIDGNYPIAGVSNNTQGMRDNFTNTKTNFQYASDEITDLQSKVLLKAALTGTTLDNNLANNVMYNAQIRGFSGVTVAIANTSGTINIDCNAGHYQSIYMAGNISLGFDSNTWPTAGTAGMVRTQITVDQAGRTMALPVAVSNGVTGIQGFSSNVITFAQAGTYEFGFLTTTGGSNITIFDLNRPLSYYTNDVTMLGNLTVSGNIIGTIALTGNISVNTVTANTMTAVGNVVGGNLLVSGIVSTTGNITGSNITSVNMVTTPRIVTNNIRSDDSSFITIEDGLNVEQGLVISGNVLTGGLISATGNVTGGNLNAAGLSLSSNVVSALNVTANIAGGNVTTPGLISATGNVNGGNIITSGLLSVTGNVTAGNLILNGIITDSAQLDITTTSGNANIVFTPNGTGNVNTDANLSVTGNVLISQGNVLVTGGTGGVGYTAGAGGTQTQATSKATGVTLNKQSGTITMNGAALAAATIVNFVLTNSTVGANDLLLLQHQSAGTLGAYTLNAACAAGSATIYVRNETAGSLSEAIVLRYAVIKGAVA